MKKKLLILLTTITILFLFGAVSVSAEEYGDLYYTVNSDNTAITITDCDAFAKEIEIPGEIDGIPVTSIGNGAFRDCSFLTNVTIGGNVTSIGSYAFDGRIHLTSVTIGGSVTSIGSYAFSDCSGLESVYISDLEAYLNIGFGNSSANPMYYASKLCLNEKQLTGSIEIPNTVTKIPVYAFAHCDGIKSVTIPDSVTSIGFDAFYGCSGLTSVTIGGSVTSIGDSAFSGCSGLTTVNYNAANCTYMGSYKYPIFSGYSALTTVNIGDNVTNIPSCAFYNCSGITSITLPDSITSIGSDAFYGCNGLESVYISDLEAYLNIGFGNSSANPNTYASKLYLNGKRITGSIEIPNTVTKIPVDAFAHCDGIKSVTIPDSVTSIGSYAFNGCSGLTSITIPDSVTSIDDGVFSGCSGLTSITIPDSVTSIGSDAFSRCSGLTSITIPDSVTSIGSYAFNGCSGLTSITIPDSVTSIGQWAFTGCRSLKDVYITDLAKWCSLSFSYAYDSSEGHKSNNPMCYAENLYLNDILLTELIIPDSVTSISSYAFYNCKNITRITIPDSVTSIGDYAFYDCSGLTSVTIGGSVTSIGGAAFYNCNSLVNVNYNAVNCQTVSKTMYGDLPFSYYNSIENINFGDNVETIPPNLFRYCKGVASIVIPEKVTAIKENSFSSCSNLMRVYIPKATAEIEKAAFQNCTALKTVEYGGSQTDWADIYIGSDNEYLSNAKVNYNSKPENAVLLDLDYLTYTKNDDNTITITNCSQVASNIVIPAIIDGLPVKTINASAFANNSKLTNVTIPDSVTSIGERAFYGCSNLKNISIPSGITTIASNTFYNCSSLEAVSLPESVTTITGYAFYGCDKLSNVYYSGNKNSWNKINFNYGNDNLKNAAVTYGKAPTYTITTGTKFGTITPDKVSAAMGEKVTFTVAPANGYMLTDGSVKVNNGDVSVTSNGNSYSFTVPDKDVTITATFEKIPPEMITVSFDANEGTLTGASTVKVEKGTALSQSSIPTAAKDGHTFAGWLLNGKTFSLDTPITENITLTALWIENEIQKTTVPTLSKFTDTMDFERSAGTNDSVIFTISKKNGSNANIPQPVVFVAHFGADGTLQSADKFDFTKSGDTYTAIVDKQTGDYKIFVWTDDILSTLEPITAPLTAEDNLFN